jgi:hypothetical protein
MASTPRHLNACILTLPSWTTEHQIRRITQLKWCDGLHVKTLTQEAVHQFTGYLQWAMPHYAIQQDVALDADDDDDDDDENEPEEDKHEEEGVEEEVLTYQVVKMALFSKTMISTLAHDYKAPNFLYHLHNFMNTQSISPRHQLALTSTIPVYKQVALKLLFLKEAASSEWKDIIEQSQRGSLQRASRKL